MQQACKTIHNSPTAGFRMQILECTNAKVASLPGLRSDVYISQPWIKSGQRPGNDRGYEDGRIIERREGLPVAHSKGGSMHPNP